MITRWALSQNHWEYETELIVESKMLPTVKTVEGPYRSVDVTMAVDGVTLFFHEPIELLEIGGKKVENP